MTMVGDPAGFGGAGGASRDLDSNYGGENTDAGTVSRSMRARGRAPLVITWQLIPLLLYGGARMLR